MLQDLHPHGVNGLVALGRAIPAAAAILGEMAATTVPRFVV